MEKEYAYGRVSNTVRAFEVLCGFDEVEGPEDYRFKTKNQYGEECIDIEKLQLFIVFDYLPKNRKFNKIGKAKNVESVTFNSLLKLNLSQSELCEVLVLLEKLNVYVTGYCSELTEAVKEADKVNNCVDIQTSELFRTFPKYDPTFGNIKKIRQYQNEKDPEKKKELRDSIVENNCRLVPYCMFKSFRNIPEFYKYDIAQEGLLALTDAIDKFDTNSQNQFSTFAYACIRYSILRSIYSIYKVTSIRSGDINCKIMKGLRTILEAEDLDESHMFDVEMIPKLYEYLYNVKHICFKSFKDLAEFMKVTEQFVNNVGTDEMNEMEESESMDLDKYDKFYTTNEIEVEDEYVEEFARKELESRFACLTDREKRVVELLFGLKDENPHTLEQAGRKLGVTRERVRQIEAKAIRKLNRCKDSRHLEGLFD